MPKTLASQTIVYSSPFVGKLAKSYAYKLDDSETWQSNGEKSPKAQLTLVIKAYIESVFTSGISSIPSFDIKPDKTMVGTFKEKGTNPQTYSFTITPSGKISYIESEFKRTDSQGDKCKVGKKCGESCVKKGYQCSRSLPPVFKRDLPGLQRAAVAGQQGDWKTVALVLGGLWVAKKILDFGKNLVEVSSALEKTEGLKKQTKTISDSNLEKRIAEEEDKIRDNPYESLIVINPKDGQVLVNKPGQQTSVNPSPAEGLLMKGAIVTHNHPYLNNVDPPNSLGVSFSQPDVATACMAEVAEMRAVSAGYRHSLKPPKGKNWNREFYETTVEPAFRKHKKTVMAGLQAQIFAGKINVQQANDRYSHEITQAVAKETGIRYTRTQIKGVTPQKLAKQRLGG